MIPSTQGLKDNIEAVITMEVAEAVKLAIAKAKSDLDRRVPEIVAGLVIRVMQRVSMESLRDELLIHIRMES